MNKWFETDSDQWCKQLSETEFKFVQLLWIDTCPSSDKEYCVLTATVDLDDYTEEDKKGYLESYQFANEYICNQIIAECIFETDCLFDSCVIFGECTEEEGIKFIENWIKEN